MIVVIISIHCVVPVLAVLLTDVRRHKTRTTHKYRVMLEQSHVIMCRLFSLSHCSNSNPYTIQKLTIVKLICRVLKMNTSYCAFVCVSREWEQL